MSSGPVTTLWARTLVDELARAGVRDVVLAPGSRSTPLVFAFDAHPEVRTRVHLDERSAAFFALGLGKSTGRPAAVVTTSGTATANLLPAVVEASQSEAPLLVLTADRPHHLRDSDANQAIDQIRIFGPFVRRFFEVAPATDRAEALRHLRGLAVRSVAAATGPAAGPVHLNLPFDKPLEPEPAPGGPGTVTSDAPESDAPSVHISTGRREATPEGLEAVLDALQTERPVLVAGPSTEPELLGAAVRAVSEAAGVPLLADPLSGGRYGPDGSHAVASYDLFLRDEEVGAALTPTAIVRVGTSPTSVPLQRWMAGHAVPHVVVDGGDRWKDHGGLATEYVHADAGDTLLAVAELVAPPASTEWLDRWAKASAAAEAALSSSEAGPHEGHLLATVVRHAPEGGSIFVSSSMPVRDLDAYGAPRPEALTVFANRGASGIDGIVSTAMGVSAGRGHAAVCVVGDVAFFHDQNGLLWAREADTATVFVLIDNDGGGIFHMLPVAEHDPAFTRYFATPHGLDFRHTADLYGIEMADVAPADLGPALLAALDNGSTSVLRVKTSRDANHQAHQVDAAAVIDAVRAALTA